MNPRNFLQLFRVGAIFASLSLHAAISITSVSPSLPSPQPLGTPVTFTVSATDTNSGPLTFQFNTAFRTPAFSVVRNFNVGALSTGVWTAQPFIWTASQAEGDYVIQVVAKDFTSGESATTTIPYAFTSLVAGGSITAVPTANPLVALVAIPPCPNGDYAQVWFQSESGGNPAAKTPFVPCQAPLSTNVYIAGMYPGTTYNISYQIQERGVSIGTGGRFQPARARGGPSTTTFTTGPLPATVSFPTATVVEAPNAQAFTPFGVALHDYLNDGPGQNYQPTATDLAGNTIWFYQSDDHNVLLTRPLQGGYMLLLQSGPIWGTGAEGVNQLVREVDLAGNVLKEINIGLLQQQLAALGAPNLVPCASVPLPAVVGSNCLTAFSHDAIRLPNGNWAVVGSMEKITPPGTQGDTSGMNVDILGDAIIVLDTNLNAIWYWNAFDHDGGGTQLDINRAAPLRETCIPNGGGCPTLLLYGTGGITSPANDWMHTNSIDYIPQDGSFLISVRHQDWLLKIDYGDGGGTGNILWRMGVDGDFTFNNTGNDPYPWFSHEHDAGIEYNGLLTLFDNGNTRITAQGGNSRGMVMTFDESTMQVTPVMSQDLGYYGYALGSAQLLPNGNYFFQPGIIAPNNPDYSLEYAPSAGALTGTEVFSLELLMPSYRTFRMPDLYNPPGT